MAAYQKWRLSRIPDPLQKIFLNAHQTPPGTVRTDRARAVQPVKVKHFYHHSHL